MRSLIFIIFLILIFVFFGGCADIKDEAPKFRNLTLNLFKNDSSSRNLRTNEDITLGIQRELIKVVQESETFSKEPSKLTKIYDSNSTNLSTNEVSLSIPLGIPVKLFAYRYQEDFGTIQNEITTNVPVSFGKSNTFILKEDTKSLTINLEISPNGIPGLIVEKNDNITSDGGGTSSFQISLKTHPIPVVTISINTNFSGVVLSQKNLEFTPLNWSKPQKIYLTGIENSLIKKSQNYNVMIGSIISNDYDYSKIVKNDIIFHHQINLLNSSDNTSGLGEWAHWTLDDSSGLDSISSRDLIVTGTPIINNGSWSLNENARGEYILQSGDNLDNFSLSIRFRIGTNDSNYDSIFSTEESPGKEGSWQIGMSGNDMKFSSTDSSYAFTLSRNIWHHLVLTKSETNQINIYANNIHLDTLTLPNWSMSRLRVGTNRNTDNLWIGDIDDVRIYDYVLDNKDINKLYHIY